MELITAGTKDATIAGAAINIEGTTYSADGTSKRDPHDDDDPEIAELLAIGRALETLGLKLQKRANGLIKHNDDMREYKKIQKSRKPSPKKRREIELKRVQGRKLVRETKCFS